MRRASLAALTLALAAAPALAHPGHGLPGWLHHGELVTLGLVTALAAAAGPVARAIVARRRRRRR